MIKVDEAGPDVADTRRRGIAPLVVTGVIAAAAVAVCLVVLTGNTDVLAAGLQDPGVVTRYGVVVARVLANAAAVVCVGSLLLAAFLVPPQRSGLVDVDGYGALRAAAAAAWTWCLAAVASAVFTAADAIGMPVTEILEPRTLVVMVDAIEQPKAWLITAFFALVLAIGCRITLSWGWTVGLFVLSVGALVPVAVTGHSASGGSHDVATNSLLFHLISAALWVGGLIAVLAVGRRRSRHLSLAVGRFSRLALVCWVVMAVSGVINAVVRMSPADLLGTDYGRLLLAKILALAALGVIGHRHRRNSVRVLTERRNRMPLIRLAAIEVMIMFGTIGVAVALGRTPPPDSGGVLPSTQEMLIGYGLGGAPTFDRLLLGWRFDLVFGMAAVVFAVLYLIGLHRLRLRGGSWPVGRTVAWLCGCLVVLLATSSGVGRYAPAMFSAHLGTHTLLAVLGPVLLVLGGPITLALRALPATGRATPPGPRDWLISLLRSPLARLLTHPALALGLLIGPFYLLYYAGGFDAVVGYHWAHLAMNTLFLVAGYLFFWPIIGIDPAPRRLPPVGRVGMMFTLLPSFGVLAVALMNSPTAVGESFYLSLDLPWVGDLLDDQRLGGNVLWALGELPALILVIVTAVLWARADDRNATRSGRGQEADDTELAAYNAMLSRLNQRGD